MRTLYALPLLSACIVTGEKNPDRWTNPEDYYNQQDDTGDTDDSGDVGDSGDSGDSGSANCSLPPPEAGTPDEVTEVGSSEDFAFDSEGNVVQLDPRGNLVRVSPSGDRTLILPGVGSLAGVHFLPDGDLAINNLSTGSVERVGMDGSREVIASGFSYPNGMNVDAEGFIYVGENAYNKLIRIDPSTGESEAIGTNFIGANGVAIGTDGKTVFVGSFGYGVVYAAENQGDGTWKTRIHAGLPGTIAAHEDDCTDLAEDDECYQQSGEGPGRCQDDGSGTITCQSWLDETACLGLSEGDACTTDRLGVIYEAVCTRNKTGVVFCPSVDPARIEACASGPGACDLDGERGNCTMSYEGLPICVTHTETSAAYTEACQDLSEGDACQILNPAHPDKGTCTSMGSWLTCLPWWSPPYTGGGGFDAMGVDECGNVYAGEYGTGIIWRWPAEGGEEPEQFDLTGSGWIPNLHWGLGAGGYARDTMYVMDLTRGSLLGYHLGLKGSPGEFHAEPVQ